MNPARLQTRRKEALTDDACPYCEASIERIREPIRESIAPRDVLVCISCHGISLFGDDFKLTKPAPELLRTLEMNPDIIEIRFALQAIRLGVNPPRPREA
jgi:hypothetical protein